MTVSVEGGPLIRGQDKYFGITRLHYAMRDDTEIIIPSYEKTGYIMARHFDVLDKLKRRISLLHQKAYSQVDFDRSWSQIESIIEILDRGTKFLTFDDDDRPSTEFEQNYYEDPSLDEEEREFQEYKNKIRLQRLKEENEAALLVQLATPRGKEAVDDQKAFEETKK